MMPEPLWALVFVLVGGTARAGAPTQEKGARHRRRAQKSPASLVGDGPARRVGERRERRLHDCALLHNYARASS